jgi:hypothetical protein
MSGGSIGTIVGGIVGAVVGYFVPGVGAWNGAQLGMMVGGAAGTALDPPKGPNNTGPRLGDLTVQTSTYGATIPRVYGTIALFGNVFWLENNKLKEVATTESAGGKGMPGMGGGETTTYSYFATFALGLCDCSSGNPIIGVRRIWIGPKLFYDAGSDDWGTLVASNQKASTFKLYLGTEDQEPNARMQATLGVNNVPGFRGLAYIVFYDLPLADYGNTLVAAQIKVEVVGSGSLGYILDDVSLTDITGGINAMSIAVSKNYAYVTHWTSGSLQVFDVIDKNNPILVVTKTDLFDEGWDIKISGTYAYIADFFGNSLKIVNIANPYDPVLVGALDLGQSCNFVSLKDDLQMAYVLSQNADQLHMVSVGQPDAPVLIDAIATGSGPLAMCIVGDYGYVVNNGSTYLSVYSLGAEEIAQVATVTVDSGLQTIVANDEGSRLYVAGSADRIQILDISDPGSPVVVYSSSSIGSGEKRLAIRDNYLFSTAPASNTLHVYSIDDPDTLALVGQISGDDYPSTLAVVGNYIYVTEFTTRKLHIFFFTAPTIASTPVPLSEIVEAEALQSNLLSAEDLDVTSLTPLVRGYRISEVGAIRAGIEPLRAAWPFDVVMHGYQIKFVLRGTASGATITEGELDARAAGEQPGVQITNSREMDYILPRKVSVKHFEYNREYDTGEQYAERINTDAVNVRDLELPIVLTAQEAAQKAEVLLYLYWMERYDIAFKLPPDYSELEPADVVTIVTDDATYELRLTSVVYTADGRLECKAKYNSMALYSPAATGEEGQSTGVTLTEHGETFFELLDIPMLQDVYDQPGFPVAMTGRLSGWPGGVLWRSDDSGHAWSAVQGFTSPGSTMGYAYDTLSEHGGTVFDKSGLLTVRMYQGELSSVTEAQLFAGSNWFAYGADERWEIIAAQNCVLQGDGSYILSDFLRGQMGSEWATGLHQNGDRVVLLSSSAMAFLSVNSSSIGVEKLFRGVTLGETLDTADNVSFVYNGVNLECLSPCHLTGNINISTSDWTLTWTRRSRFAGWRGFVDAELGEASASYEVDVFADNTYATIKRTLTSTTENVSYTSAQQIADFGSLQTTLYVKCYQLSSVVGRGYPLIAQITREYVNPLILQLSCDGTNGSTTFTDGSPNPKTITANGNAQISTAWSYAGTGSALFDGTGDTLTASSSEFLTGSGDFSWDIRFKMNNTSGTQVMLFLGDLTNYYQIIIGDGSIRINRAISGGSSDDISVSQSLDTSGHRLQWVKSGSTNTLYYDGVSLGSWTRGDYSFITTNNLYIGANPVGVYYNGYMDDITMSH